MSLETKHTPLYVENRIVSVGINFNAGVPKDGLLYQHASLFNQHEPSLFPKAAFVETADFFC